jgi:two-component system response regulator NreC
MNTALNILIVEDHPTMIEGYKSILSAQFKLDDEVKIVTAFNCEIAYQKITAAIVPYDIALLDMIIPPFEAMKLFSGEELALLLQQKMPHCKIIMSTSHTEAFVLYNLIKKVNPSGVLVKSDYNPEEFLFAIQKIREGDKYFSATAKLSIKEVHQENQYLDSYNRRIISLLAKGIKTKNLPQHLNISISAIDKRKAHIRDVFGIQKGNDEDIIREAKKRGLI